MSSAIDRFHISVRNSSSSSTSTLHVASQEPVIETGRSQSSSSSLPRITRSFEIRNSASKAFCEFFNNFPTVHIQHSLEFLDYRSLCNFQVTSQSGNILGADEKLWKYLLCHRFCLIPENVENEKEKNQRIAKEGWEKAHTERIEKLKGKIEFNGEKLQHLKKRVVYKPQPRWQSIQFSDVLQIGRLREQRQQLTDALNLHEKILTKGYFQRKYFKREFVRREGGPSHVVGKVELRGMDGEKNSLLKTMKKACEYTSKPPSVTCKIIKGHGLFIHYGDVDESEIKEIGGVSFLDASIDGEGGVHFLTDDGGIYYCKKGGVQVFHVYKGSYKHTPHAILSVYPDFYIVADRDVIPVADRDVIPITYSNGRPELAIQIVRRGVGTEDRNSHKFCHNREFITTGKNFLGLEPWVSADRKRFTIDAPRGDGSKGYWEAEIEFFYLRDFWEKIAEHPEVFFLTIGSEGFRGLQPAESAFLAQCLVDQYLRDYPLPIADSLMASYRMWSILSSYKEMGMWFVYIMKIADDESITYAVEPPKFFKDKFSIGAIQQVWLEEEHFLGFTKGLEKFKVKTPSGYQCYRFIPKLKPDHIKNAIQLFLGATLQRRKKENTT